MFDPLCVSILILQNRYFMAPKSSEVNKLINCWNSSFECVLIHKWCNQINANFYFLTVFPCDPSFIWYHMKITIFIVFARGNWKMFEVNSLYFLFDLDFECENWVEIGKMLWMTCWECPEGGLCRFKCFCSWLKTTLSFRNSLPCCCIYFREFFLSHVV